MRKTKPRILICQPNLSGGGQERITLTLVQGLIEQGFDVNLLLHEDVAQLDFKINQATLTICNSGNYNRRRILKIFGYTIFYALRSDLVIAAAEGRTGFITILASKLVGKPVIGWIHSDWREFSQYVSWRTRYALNIYKFADHIVAVSEGALEGICELINLKRKSKNVIYNGIYIKRIREMARLGVPDEHRKLFTGNTLVAVGRLDREKGLDTLLKSVSIVIRGGHNVKLVVVGSGSQKKFLQRLAQDLFITEQVSFVGFQSNPYAYMAMSTMVVVPSRFEGFGLVVAEALAVKAPVIATNCKSGPKEILNDGEYGILIPVNSPEILADQIVRLMSDKEIMHEFSIRGQTRAEFFDIRNFSAAWKNTIMDNLKTLAEK